MSLFISNNQFHFEEAACLTENKLHIMLRFYFKSILSVSQYCECDYALYQSNILTYLNFQVQVSSNTSFKNE